MNKVLEDLQAGRDPFAPSHNEENGESYQKLAKWSKWLVILAGVLAFAVSHALSDAPAGDPSAKYVRLGTGGVCVLMMLVSLVLGVIALCAIRKYGTEGILRPALSGVCISIFCIYLFGSGFIQDYRNARARAEVNEKIKEIRARDKIDYTNDTSISSAEELKRVNEAESILNRAAQNSTGDQALISRAMSAYLAKAKVLLAGLARTSEPVREVAAFDMSEVNRHDQLKAQIQQVKNFMAANEKLLAFVKNSDNVLIGELQSAGLSQTGIDGTMRGYRRGIAGQNELVISIRLQEKRTGEALLGALGLLDANWGKWRYSSEKSTVLFDDHTVWKKYIACLKDLEAAQKEEANLQHQLLSLKSKQ